MKKFLDLIFPWRKLEQKVASMARSEKERARRLLCAVNSINSEYLEMRANEAKLMRDRLRWLERQVKELKGNYEEGSE